jgi:UPF0716 protein FxsA
MDIFMFIRLFLIFVTVPLVELALLIKIGTYIGTFSTILIVILTAALGAFMAKLEGIGVMYRIQENLSQGVFPADELISGLMILVAGVLLLTPGFITDVLGFLMVFPSSREPIKGLLKRYIERRIRNIHIHRL